MAKRKVEQLQEGIPPEEPRRSSRRVSTAKAEVVPETKKKASSAPSAKKAKKGVEKVTSELSTLNGGDGKSEDSVGVGQLL